MSVGELDCFIWGQWKILEGWQITNERDQTCKFQTVLFIEFLYLSFFLIFGNNNLTQKLWDETFCWGAHLSGKIIINVLNIKFLKKIVFLLIWDQIDLPFEENERQTRSLDFKSLIFANTGHSTIPTVDCNNILLQKRSRKNSHFQLYKQTIFTPLHKSTVKPWCVCGCKDQVSPVLCLGVWIFKSQPNTLQLI